MPNQGGLRTHLKKGK